jgi:hypothetical protein
MRLAILVVLAAMTQTAQAAEALGRIFYTPEQRAQLDNLRKQRAIVSQARDEPAPETVTYNGIVRRSDGNTVVWMNNQPLSDTELRSRQTLVGSIGRDGRLTLNNPEGIRGPKLELKVGQSATLLSGKVDDSFATKKLPLEKIKPQDQSEIKPVPEVSSKNIPPELAEILRQAAIRAREKSTPASPEPGVDAKPRVEMRKENTPR